MKEKLLKLKKEYEDMEHCLVKALDLVDNKEYGEGKLEIVRMILKDIDGLLKAV